MLAASAGAEVSGQGGSREWPQALGLEQRRVPELPRHSVAWPRGRLSLC